MHAHQQQAILLSKSTIELVDEERVPVLCSEDVLLLLCLFLLQELAVHLVIFLSELAG